MVRDTQSLSILTEPMERNGVFRASTFFGVFPFRRRGSVLQANKLLFAYSLVFNAIVGIVYSYYSGNVIWFFNLKSYYIYLVSSFYGFHVAVMLRFPFIIYHQKEAVVKTIHDLNTLESSFRKMGLEINDCFRKRTIFYEMFVPVLCGIAFHFGRNSDSIFCTVGLTVGILEMTLTCGQFCFLVDSVSDFFDSGIKLLTLIAHPSSRQRIMRTVERFVVKTGRLMSILRSLNAIYSRQILWSMIVHFVAITVQLYYVFYNSTTDEKWKRICIPGDLLMVSYRFYFVWRVSHSAAQAGDKVCNILNLCLFVCFSKIFFSSNKLSHDAARKLLFILP